MQVDRYGIIDSMVMSNIKYSIQRTEDASLGLGKRNMSYINPKISTWDNDNDFLPFDHEVEGGEYHDYDQSHWITGREFDEEVGLLTIYFNPFTTNCKPPVVLGYLGAPITRGFVRSLDEGIYSEYYGYNNSQGAFYKKFIQQVFFYDGEVTVGHGSNKHKMHYSGKVKNSTRVVDAIGWEDLQGHKQKIQQLGKSRKFSNSDEPEAYARIRKHLLGIEKNYFNHLSLKQYIDRQAKSYAKKLVKKSIQKITGHTIDKDVVQRAIIDKLVPSRIMAEVKGAGKAEAVINKAINAKGIKIMGKASRGAVMTDATRAAASEAAVFAPELIPFIIAGVVVGKMVGNHKTAKQTGKAMAGTEGLDVLSVLAFKIKLKEDIKKQIGYQGIDKLILDKEVPFKRGGLNSYSNFRPREVRADLFEAKETWSKDFQSGFYRPGSLTKYETADQARKGQMTSKKIMRNKKSKIKAGRIW